MMKFFPFSSKVFILVCLNYLILLHYRDGIQRLSYNLFGAYQFVLALFCSYLLGLFFHYVFCRYKKVYGVGLVILSALYSLFSLYHYRAKSNFTFSLVADNFGEAFSRESFDVMVGMFKMKDFFQPLAVGLFVAIFYFFPKLYQRRTFWRIRFPVIVGGLLLYIGGIFCRLPIYEEFSAFFQSVYDYYSPLHYQSELYTQLKNIPSGLTRTYDYSRFPLRASFKPHIFVIAMESFSGAYIEKNEQGKEVTPFFNSLIGKSVYAPNFFSNSIQTAKGHFALNCGRLPMIRDKAFYHADGLSLNCLPAILKKDNYRTIFFQHYSDANFDQTRKFMLKNGFDYFYTANANTLSAEDREKFLWGWGLQDDQSFKQFFKQFDLLSKSSTPTYSFIATISHHMRFRSLPKALWDIYPDAGRDKRMNFINSLHAADLFLRTFFDELKVRGLENKSIVVLVGDHGYPNGQHGNFHSETGAFQESFSVPLLIYAPFLLKSMRLDGTYSQVDLAPTILSLLGAKGDHTFIGNSVLDGSSGLVAHLIQPYDGVHLGTISYPYKYVLHLRTGRESFYNLKNDPLENDNIISSNEARDELKRLSNEVGRIFYNDELLNQNK